MKKSNRDRVCGNKKGFSNFTQAKKAIARMKKDKTALAGNMNIYRCVYCHLWHFGHNSGGLGKPKLLKEEEEVECLM